MKKRSCSLVKRIFKKVKRKTERANFQIETRDVFISFEEQIKKENLPIHSALIHAQGGSVILVLYLQQERYAIYMGTNFHEVRLLDLFYFPNMDTITPICREPYRSPCGRLMRINILKEAASSNSNSLEALDRLAFT